MGKWVQNKPKFQQDKYNIMEDLMKFIQHKKERQPGGVEEISDSLGANKLANKKRLHQMRKNLYTVQTSRTKKQTYFEALASKRKSRLNFLETKSKLGQSETEQLLRPGTQSSSRVSFQPSNSAGLMATNVLPDYIVKLRNLPNSEKSKLERKIPKRYIQLLEEVLYSGTAKLFKFASKLAISHMNDFEMEESFKGVFLSCQFLPSKMMQRYTSLAAIKNSQWLEHKITKLMHPDTDANSFREFLKQISKYLVQQESERQAESQAVIQKKLEYLKAYKKVVREFEEQGKEVVKYQKLPTVIEENDYSDWIKANFMPEYMLNSQNESISPEEFCEKFISNKDFKTIRKTKLPSKFKTIKELERINS